MLFCPSRTIALAGAEAPDGAASARSARAAGGYAACFELKDPATCEWADGSGSGEAWVPWSIALSPFDPSDPEVMRWGTANGNTTTKLTYAGEPVWVRPWFTPAEATDGDFPDWFSHWGGAGRPYADRLGVMDAGTYKAYAFFDEGAGFAATSLAEADVTVSKAANALTVKTAKKTVKASKKARTVKPVTKATAKYKATVTYARATTAKAKKLNGYKGKTLTVDKKTGKVTVKAGTKPGTYKLMVKATAAATANTKAAAETFTVTVKVK